MQINLCYFYDQQHINKELIMYAYMLFLTGLTGCKTGQIKIDQFQNGPNEIDPF